jgi:hypothetical protein
VKIDENPAIGKAAPRKDANIMDVHAPQIRSPLPILRSRAWLRVAARCSLVCTATTPVIALAQASAASGAVGIVADVDVYAKVVGGVLTGLGTLFGLPLLYWSYKKTRVEINKLELEAAALKRNNNDITDESTRGSEAGTQISVSHSRDVTVQVLADPRFLGPLLLLLDFIFAWVILTLAGYFLDIVEVGISRTLALAMLAALLLLPIAKEARRVRSVLRPSQSPDEYAATLRQAKFVAYTVFGIITVTSLAFCAILFTADNVTGLGRILAWTLLSVGIANVACAPLVKARVDRYLARIVGSPPISEADE